MTGADTLTLKAGTRLFHDRWTGAPWDPSDLRFPAWFSFDGTYAWARLIHDDPGELLEFEVTRDVALMDGNDAEIQMMYENGAHTDDIACIPRERGTAGWIIPASEVLLNDPAIVRLIGVRADIDKGLARSAK